MPLRKSLDKLLGRFLVEKEIITPEQLQQVLSIQEEKGGLIVEILLKTGFAKEEDIDQILTTQCGFPYLPLDNYEIDPEIIKIIPQDLARLYSCVPVDRLGGSLSVAMSNPLNNEAIERIEALTGFKVHVFVSMSDDIRNTIDKYYKEKTDQ